LAAILEITYMPGPSSQSPRDRILWILSNHGGKMKRDSLRVATGLRLATLNLLLDELATEGKINITPSKQGDMISIKI
jgi:hypothetical protein